MRSGSQNDLTIVLCLLFAVAVYPVMGTANDDRHPAQSPSGSTDFQGLYSTYAALLDIWYESWSYVDDDEHWTSKDERHAKNLEKNFERTTHAAQAVGLLKGGEIILQAMESPDPDIRFKAREIMLGWVFVLSQPNDFNDPLYLDMAERLFRKNFSDGTGDSHWRVRSAAYESWISIAMWLAISQNNQDFGVEEKLDKIKNEIQMEDRAIQALDDDHVAVRIIAFESLESLGRRNIRDRRDVKDKIISSVKLAMKHPDPYVRTHAIGALASLGQSREDRPQVIPLLIMALKDSDKKIRIYAIDHLSLLGPDSRDAIPVLKRLAKSEDRHEREYARKALRDIGGDSH